MLVSAILIVVSFFWLNRTFKKADSVQGSSYKNHMQCGWLIIAVDYVIRALYSGLFKFYKNVFKNDSRFYGLAVQTLLNLLMDIPVIFVILFMNRTTIQMRKRLAEEEERRRQIELNRLMITRSFIERVLENGREKDQSDTSSEDTQTLDPSDRSHGVKSVLTVSDLSDPLSDLDTGPNEEQKLYAILKEEYWRRRQQDMAERFIMPDQDEFFYSSKQELSVNRIPNSVEEVFLTTKSQMGEDQPLKQRTLSE